jgi:hypothetical protein
VTQLCDFKLSLQILIFLHQSLLLQHLLCAVTNPLHLGVSPLHHVLHALLCLLQIVREHVFVQLKFAQPLVVVLTRSLYQLICTFRRLDGGFNGGAAGLARWRGERDLDCERLRRLGRKGGEGVRRGGDGGGDWFDVLWNG